MQSTNSVRTSDKTPTPSGGQSVWDDLRALRKGRPGDRFQNFSRRRRLRRGKRHYVSHIATHLVGIALIIGGLAIGWLPGPGGFIAIIGLAVIAQELPIVARMMDAVELGLHRTWRAIRRRF